MKAKGKKAAPVRQQRRRRAPPFVMEPRGGVVIREPAGGQRRQTRTRGRSRGRGDNGLRAVGQIDRFGNLRPPPPDCFSDDNLPAGVESGDDFWDMPDLPVFPAGPGPIALAERLVYRFTGEGEDPFVGEDLEDFPVKRTF